MPLKCQHQEWKAEGQTFISIQEQDACLEATSESACVTKETHSSLSEQARQALQAGQDLLLEIGWWLAWQTLLFTHVAQSCH